MDGYAPPLSPEEYETLSCTKDGWKKDEVRYDEFLTILKKYIAHYQTCPQIDLSSFAFPEITFNHDLLGTASVFVNQSTFYGKTVFEHLTFHTNVRISNCIFSDTVRFEDIVFHEDADIMHNTFEQPVELKEMTFDGEAYFAHNNFSDILLLDTLNFSNEASFTDSLLRKTCTIKNIKDTEQFEWDDLYCMNRELCEWDELENYIARKEPNEIWMINLVQEIKKQFPEVIDDIKEEQYQTSMGWSCFGWIEQFGLMTRDLLRKKAYGQAQMYLNFMDRILKTDDQDKKNILETGFVENILWELTPEQQKAAWKYVPERTKKSYALIWSVPS